MENTFVSCLVSPRVKQKVVSGLGMLIEQNAKQKNAR